MTGETIYNNNDLTIVRNSYLKAMSGTAFIDDKVHENVTWYWYEYQLFSNNKFRLMTRANWYKAVAATVDEFNILDKHATEILLRDYQKIIDSGEEIKQWEQ